MDQLTLLKQTRLIASTLSRVWTMWEDPNRSFVIMTAFRGSNSLKQNIRDNLALAAKLRAAGFGYFWLEGFFIENEGLPNEQRVSEDSIFVSADAEEKEHFKKTIMELLNEYEQESALYKPAGSKEVFLLKPTGELQSIGTDLKPNQIAKNYSKLKGTDKTFVFAQALVNRSNLGIMSALKEAALKYPTLTKLLDID